MTGKDVPMSDTRNDLPLGFSAGAAAAGFKKAGRDDLGLIVSDRPAVLAGLFTTNAFKAAPVQVCQQTLREYGTCRAVLANSGQANACTGDEGLENCLETRRMVAALTGLAPHEIMPMSTGVIGDQLKMDRWREAVPSLVESLGSRDAEGFTRAFMTTDAFPKFASITVPLSGGTVRLTGMAKGAGMICPNMATMLAVMLTDADVDRETWQAMFARAVDKTFNRVSVDGDTSTNDTILGLANGASGIRAEGEDAALLEKGNVLDPTAYKQREGRKTPHQTPENEYRWHESTVAYILEYMEYTGCTVNFKTYTNSIWDKKQRENPMENRKIFYNTHPAIISLEVFDKVQEIRQQRHRRTATGKSNMFSGLVFCNDCKQKLYYSTTSYFEKRQDFFICSTHRVNKDKCSGHYIRAVVLEQIVWKHIQEVISVVTRYEAYFRSEMEQKLRIQSEESLRLYQKRLAQAEKRIGELDRLFIRIYEDNVAGRLDDERFAMMSRNYTEEQKDLKAEVKGLQQQIHEQEQQAENIEQFVQRVKRNSTLTELTPYALRELVKAVYVDAPDKSSGKRRQKVHIEYDLVGYIPVDELLKAEQA